MGINKRILTALTAAAAALTVFAGCADKTDDTSSAEDREAVKNAGVMRDLTAQQYADDMGIGINLGNTFEAFWENKNNKSTGSSTIGADTPYDYETCWGAVITTEECIHGMKEAGFSTVRIPVYWGNMMEDDGNYTISEDYITRVEEVADWVIEEGMYAVINIHHYDAFLIKNKDKEEVLEITGKLWTQIAEHFKDKSDYLIFEGFNESLGENKTEYDADGNEKKSRGWENSDEAYDYVNSMNKVFVDSVRQTGGNNEKRLLIVSGYWTNIDKTTSDKFVIPEDTVPDKLMVSVHYVDNAMYWTNKIGGEEWKEYTASQTDLLKKAFIDKGIPVFLGEQTSRYEPERILSDAETTESSALMGYEMKNALDNGFVPVLWDVNNNFYSRTENKIISSEDEKVIQELAGKTEEKDNAA